MRMSIFKTLKILLRYTFAEEKYISKMLFFMYGSSLFDIWVCHGDVNLESSITLCLLNL